MLMDLTTSALIYIIKRVNSTVRYHSSCSSSASLHFITTVLGYAAFALQQYKKLLVYSILFFPSSALKKRAVLIPLSCLATSPPSTLSLRSLLTVSLYPSVAHGRGMSLGQLTCVSVRDQSHTV